MMSCENLSIMLYLKSRMVISNNPTKELMKSPESLGPWEVDSRETVVALRYTTQIEHYDNMGAIFVPQKRRVDFGSWR